MIRISLGNVGSGKTACEVREMFINRFNRTTYTNILTKKIPNAKVLTAEHIISKIPYKTVKKKGGDLEQVYKYELNKSFWSEQKLALNVVLDEAHSILNARRSMSKINIIVSDWLALIRRVLGATEQGQGELVLISQLSNRLDMIARDMATQVRYHVCHYLKTCKKCNSSFGENSETPEEIWQCLNCGSGRIYKHQHIIEVWFFTDMDNFHLWKYSGVKTYYKRIYVNDIETIFSNYNTLQWDNMFSNFY